MGLSRRTEYYIYWATTIMLLILIATYMLTGSQFAQIASAVVLPFSAYIIFDYKDKYGITPGADTSITGSKLNLF
jgi:uncharacterized membrane protein YhaH (DUF805 family)